MVKKAQAKPKKTVDSGSKVRPLSKKQAKLKAKATASKQPPMAGSFTLLAETYNLLKQNWRPLGGIVLIYVLLNAVFATGIFSDLNSSISTARQTHHFSDALGGYGSLLSLGSSSGSAQSGSSVSQSLLLVLESLVIIWALRHLLAGEKITTKQAYYHSMYPMVQFFIVIFFLILQLLPITLGALFLSLVLGSVVTGGALVTVIFSLIFLVLAAWSVYLLSGSVFALYIVTLPDMQPRQALRSAKNLVCFRRWMLLRRLFFLPLFIFLVLGIVTVPLILALPFLVAPAFFLLLMLTVLFAHTYLYNLYRSLIA